MIWFFAVVVVLVMGGIALVASGFGTPMVDEYDDRPDALVPESGELGAADLRRVRFSLAFRGYRMAEVDELLSRLATQLESERAWQPAPVEPPSDGPASSGPVSPGPASSGPGGFDRPDDVPPQSPAGPVPPG